MTTTTHPPVTTSRGSLAPVAALSTVAAVATTLSIFAVARAVGVDFDFVKAGSTERATTIAPAMVVTVTLLTMAVGWVFAGLAVRVHRPGLRSMAAIGGVFAVLSSLAPLSLDADTSVKVTLAGLHLVTGAFYVAGIARLRRTEAGETR